MTTYMEVILKQSKKKTPYRGSTDLLQNKNNIKPQNNEKKITSLPICSMCKMDIQPFR